MGSSNSSSSSLRRRNSYADLLSTAMNKFLKKKPSEGLLTNDDTLNALSQPPSPALKKSGTSRWKKNKKQPEVKPRLDLSSVLPPSDDFRTSLIMPSLSTRFSMLREQDDPHSKLGKASDDSVLQPRRKSRMADFGYHPSPLFDIAEVSSLKSSIRPPLADVSRQHSFVSDEMYHSDAEVQPSVMTRSRPGEGNTLFGGRQKIYKIPTSGTMSTKSLGKLVYDDDVGMSAFQKYRARDREQDESQFPRPSDESQGFDFGLSQAESGGRDENRLIGYDTLPNDSAKDLSHSPSLSSYDKKRSTTSSTARSDARSSTAATSIASQSATTSAQPSPAHPPSTTLSAAPSSTSGNCSSLERSGTKTRRLYEQGLDQHMQDQQSSAMSRLNSLQRQRGMGSKAGQQPHLHGARSTGNMHERSTQQAYGYRTRSPSQSSPLPPLSTKPRSANSGASSPSLGAPQSPVDSHWDENKVLTQALEPADRGKATALGAFNKPAQAFDEQQYLERQKALQRSTSNAAVRQRNPTQTGSSPFDERADRDQIQGSPDSTDGARSHSASRPGNAVKAYNVFHNAASQIPSMPPTAKSSLPDTHRTFFGNISASEDEEDDDESQHINSFEKPDYGYYNAQGRWQPTQLQSVSEHPALRSQKSKTSLVEVNENNDLKATKKSASSRSLRNGMIDFPAPKPGAFDSPTLGPQAQPLDGMVHHLRQGSNNSSLYPADDFALNDETVPRHSDGQRWYSGPRSSSGDAMPLPHDSTYSVSSPWSVEEHGRLNTTRSGTHIDYNLFSDSGDRLSHHSEVSPLQTSAFENQRPPFLRQESEVSCTSGEVLNWQQELRKQHSRDASTATQQEREAFANDLAARRAAIEESIKNKRERDNHSRGTSPAGVSLRALGALRSKSSRESVAHAQDGTPKLRRPSGSIHSVDTARIHNDPSSRPPLPTGQHPAFKAEGPGPSNGTLRDLDPLQAERMLASSRSTQSSRSRSRSNSGATATANGRSRSRTGPYRDDLEKAMVEGHGSSATAHTPEVTPFPSASPDIMFSSDYDYEGGKTFNYFDSHPTTSANPGPNGFTPGRPVPIANAFSQNTTPPLTASNPAAPGSAYTPIVPSSARGGPGLRKKTISKHDISEPTLISSTSNVDTVELPEGASLKNGMEEAPPIPPINPRRRTTRKLFGRNRSESSVGDHEPKATVSDPNLLLNAAPSREYHFQPSPVVRMPHSAATSPAVPQFSFGQSGSPERTTTNPRAVGMQRSVTAGVDGAMF